MAGKKGGNGKKAAAPAAAAPAKTGRSKGPRGPIYVQRWNAVMVMLEKAQGSIESVPIETEVRDEIANGVRDALVAMREALPEVEKLPGGSAAAPLGEGDEVEFTDKYVEKNAEVVEALGNGPFKVIRLLGKQVQLEEVGLVSRKAVKPV
ncbi:MAG: hypothetical protein V2A73_13845 [Pseudomonadota bacterium]